MNGVHYHFVELEKMEEAVSRGEFLEHARVHANMYGTSAKAVEEVTVTSKCIVNSILLMCITSFYFIHTHQYHHLLMACNAMQ